MFSHFPPLSDHADLTLRNLDEAWGSLSTVLVSCLEQIKSVLAQHAPGEGDGREGRGGG